MRDFGIVSPARSPVLCASKWHTPKAGRVKRGWIKARPINRSQLRRSRFPSPRLRTPQRRGTRREIVYYWATRGRSEAFYAKRERERGIPRARETTARHVAMFWLASIDPPLILRRSITSLPSRHYPPPPVHPRPGSVNYPRGGSSDSQLSGVRIASPGSPPRTLVASYRAWNVPTPLWLTATDVILRGLHFTVSPCVTRWERRSQN